MTLQIWNLLTRTVSDPTTIDEAIEDAVTAHNADPEAHLGDDESLQSHRASEIIDHIAESVVNDKIRAVARTYVAIVDPDSDEDFDTIESAHAYAITKGGGSIFIVPGEYYLSDIIEIDGSVNFIGADPDTTSIHTDYSDDKYFQTCHWPTGWAGSFVLRNITIIADTPYAFFGDGPNGVGSSTMIIDGCTFSGAGGYLIACAYSVNMRDSLVYLSTVGVFSSAGSGTFTNVRCTSVETTGSVFFFDSDIEVEQPGCTFINLQAIDFPVAGGGFRCEFFGGCQPIWASFLNCSIYYFKSDLTVFDSCSVLGCRFSMATSEVFVAQLLRGIFAGNLIYSGAAANFQLESGSAFYTFIGNQITGYSGSVVGRGLLEGNISYEMYVVLSTSATAMALLNNAVSELTPNSTRTLTTTVPPKGSVRKIIILTSGTTSYTLTFGTGFKTTGTLATGVTSARRFVINFVSDGTSLIETSRTVAIA